MYPLLFSMVINIDFSEKETICWHDQHCTNTDFIANVMSSVVLALQGAVSLEQSSCLIVQE